jgi:hypothetical protein
VNQKYYLEVLDRLRKRVIRVRIDPSSFITTARPHTQHCQFVNFWRKSAFVCFRRLLVLQISPYAFYLFPKLKSRVKCCHFQTLDSVQNAVTDAIKTLTKANFQSCYEAWKIHWARGVASEGCCYDGDNVDSDE